jgi:hypothetical protein
VRDVPFLEHLGMKVWQKTYVRSKEDQAKTEGKKIFEPPVLGDGWRPGADLTRGRRTDPGTIRHCSGMGIGAP